MSNKRSVFAPADTTANVYFVASPNTGPGYQIYTEEDLEAFGGVHALERALEAESYWFVHLGEVRVMQGSSGVCFKDSDLALLREPPEHTWKIGRCNPAFGKPELDRYVFGAAFKAVERMLELWKKEDEGVVDAYALKELNLSPERLAALTNCLSALQKTQDVVGITIMKYWYDASWPGRPFPCDLVTAEFSLNLPLQFRWAASDKLLDVAVMHFSLC
jgi:hypothetical protein